MVLQYLTFQSKNFEITQYNVYLVHEQNNIVYATKESL